MADTKYLKDNLKGFVPVEVAGGIMDEIARGSAVLQLSDVKPMKSDTMKFQVWADKPGAYWVGEGERINTSKASWIFPEMQAKKIAVIIPVTREKLNDTTIDVFEELKAVCKCGAKANFNLRLNKIDDEFVPVFSGEQVSIDGIDAEYDSVCRPCYKKLKKKILNYPEMKK